MLPLVQHLKTDQPSENLEKNIGLLATLSPLGRNSSTGLGVRGRITKGEDKLRPYQRISNKQKGLRTGRPLGQPVERG